MVLQRLEDFNQIQAMRLEFGAPVGDCPQVAGFYRPGKEGIRIAEGAELSAEGHLTGGIVLNLPLAVPTRIGDLEVHLETASVSFRSADCFLVDGVLAWRADTEGDPQHRLTASANWYYLGGPAPIGHEAASAATPFLPRQLGLHVWNGASFRFPPGSYRCAVRLASATPPRRVAILAQRIQGIEGVSNTPRGFSVTFETKLDQQG